MKELVIFDVDGVIIKGQSQQLFIQYLLKKKVISLSYYAKLALWFIFYKLGLIKNPTKAMEFAFLIWMDKKTEELDNLVKDFFNTSLINYVFKEAAGLVKQHQGKGDHVVLVSNAISPIIKEIANYLGVRDIIATVLETENGVMTGKVQGDPTFGKYKVEKINNYIKNNNLSDYKITVYDDHISDLQVMEMAAVPIAANPDNKLLKEAGKRNWKVIKFK